jgi:hypothetical protein
MTLRRSLYARPEIRLRSHGRWPPRRMRMATPGQARRSLVRESPLIRLTRGLPGTTNCCCEHAFQRRFFGWPCRAPPAQATGEEVAGGGVDRGTRRGPGCRQGRGGGLPSASLTLPARVGSGTTPPGGPHLPDVHLQPGGPGRLAAGRGRHPGGDGGDGPAAGSPSGRCWRSAGWSCCWSTPATTRLLPGRKTPSMSSCGGFGCLLGEPFRTSTH